MASHYSNHNRKLLSKQENKIVEVCTCKKFECPLDKQCKKPRLRFKDGNETFINLSYTGDWILTQECFDVQTDILMIIGFGRPWEGNKKIPFPIKRCDLIAVGIVYRNYVSY